MNICCLDMEGVLTPEIWIEFAHATGIELLTRTTRDEPDYSKLMSFRMGILREHGLRLKDIQDVIATLSPLEGARDFLDNLREKAQVIILSDTFEEFAQPLMRKLGWPTIFCNSLVVDEDGFIVDFKMRCTESKYETVKGLQSIGFDTICAGDSFNDIAMIRASKEGFLFRTTDEIRSQNPDLCAYETYDELLCAFERALEH